MHILVDGDACPVISECEDAAVDFNAKLIIYTDLAHQISSEIGQVIYTDTAKQSVDMLIYSECKANDIVITQDYGLAALVLGKKAIVLNHYGNCYNNKNIDQLLMLRHLNAKARRAGNKHPTYSKRTDEDNKNFKKELYLQLRKYNKDDL
ncbi:MAG: DUF188 domain-containing protein [Halanaerobiaceae bacterium]